MIYTLDCLFVPKTVGEALAHSAWLDAMIDEINALDNNDTWELVELYVDKKKLVANGNSL